MKKFVSLVLALALCLGLAAPALAVEHSVTNEQWDGATLTVTVDAVSVKTVTLVLFIASPNEPENKEVELATVVPGTVVSVKDGNGESTSAHYYEYERTADGYSFSGEGVVFDGETLNLVEGWDGVLQIEDMWVTFATEDTTSTTTAPTTGTTEGSTTTAPTTSTETAPTTGTTTTETAPTTTPVEGGVVYTVKQYDTMGKIALNYYGSYGYHLALYKANSEAFAKTGGNFNTGMTLTLPDTLAGKARLAEPTLAEGESFYTVKAGDTLGAIAAATYGDIMMYEEIYERNADRLKNANTIFEGQVIVLPAK